LNTDPIHMLTLLFSLLEFNYIFWRCYDCGGYNNLIYSRLEL
jgi:hypothetical protein